LEPGVFFSEVALEDALVLEDLDGRNSDTLKILKGQTRIELPLEGMVGFKVSSQESFNPVLVRELPAKVSKDKRVNVSFIYTSPLVKLEYPAIQEKLMSSFDKTSNLEEKMLSISRRGKNKLTENDILDLFMKSTNVSISPSDMIVSTLEVLK
jgi:hypothetical protein